MSIKKRIGQLNVEISEDVLQFRKGIEMSQIEFSKLLGVSQPHLSKIENGLSQLTAAQYCLFLELVTKLGVKK